MNSKISASEICVEERAYLFVIIDKLSSSLASYCDDFGLDDADEEVLTEVKELFAKNGYQGSGDIDLLAKPKGKGAKTEALEYVKVGLRIESNIQLHNNVYRSFEGECLAKLVKIKDVPGWEIICLSEYRVELSEPSKKKLDFDGALIQAKVVADLVVGRDVPVSACIDKCRLPLIYLPENWHHLEMDIIIDK